MIEYKPPVFGQGADPNGPIASPPTVKTGTSSFVDSFVAGANQKKQQDAIAAAKKENDYINSSHKVSGVGGGD
jgi:hypothetical protein